MKIFRLIRIKLQRWRARFAAYDLECAPMDTDIVRKKTTVLVEARKRLAELEASR